MLTTLAHDEIANPPTHSQGSDAPGRAFSSADGRRSSFGETDRHRHAQEKFAAHAEAELEKLGEHAKGGFVIIAPPRTLGTMRQHYGTRVRKNLPEEIPKDVTGHMTDDIAQVIAGWTP